jgi:hypothetical protein
MMLTSKNKHTIKHIYAENKIKTIGQSQENVVERQV